MNKLSDCRYLSLSYIAEQVAKGTDIPYANKLFKEAVDIVVNTWGTKDFDLLYLCKILCGGSLSSI
jgi:hypothetical protein